VAALALGATALLLVLGGRLRRRRFEARAYLRGVRYVLSDDPDAAIEALSDAARLGTPEAAETYLALGALFRRTGDLARAIRLHRNMLLRPGLPPEGRAEVERELAEDYRRGGMPGEAEAAYRRLWERGDRRGGEGLRDVLADAGRLADAAEVQRALSGGAEDPVLAHLLAALARSHLPGEAAAAREAARRAVAACPASADALLAVAEAEGAAGDARAAGGAVRSALEADPRAALLAWPALEALGDPDRGLAVLDGLPAPARDGAALRHLRGRLLLRAGREPAALEVLRDALEADYSGEVALATRELLREASAPRAEELAARHALLLDALQRRARSLHCARCGQEAPLRAWRCKRCGAFDAFGAA
jgi:lipopolysaccharide biosynthesis regulator YciM